MNSWIVKIFDVECLAEEHDGGIGSVESLGPETTLEKELLLEDLQRIVVSIRSMLWEIFLSDYAHLTLPYLSNELLRFNEFVGCLHWLVEHGDYVALHDQQSNDQINED